MKNILIIGPARVGKSDLSIKINKELGYNIVNIDDIISAFEQSFPQLNIRHDEDDEKTAQNIGDLFEYLNHLASSSNFNKKINFVIEGTQIDFKKMFSILNINKYIIIGLTYNKLNAEELYSNIKKFDTQDDWTYWCNEKELKGNIEYFIKRNQFFDKKFKEYNICAYDVSQNREDCFEKIIKNLKILELK